MVFMVFDFADSTHGSLSKVTLHEGAYALAFGLVIWGVKDAFASWRTDHMAVIHEWSVVIAP